VSNEDLSDPRSMRWVEAGVSGIPRQREWDSVELLEVPELEALELEELRFGRLGDGTIVRGDDAPVDEAVLVRFAERIERSVPPPYEALAARRTRLQWSVAARRLRIEEVELPNLEATELVVAIGPDGEPSLHVDGEEPAVRTPELAAATAQLEGLGADRFDSFVVRATRIVGDRFAFSVDPL
jgi:hypothetical protein